MLATSINALRKLKRYIGDVNGFAEALITRKETIAVTHFTNMVAAVAYPLLLRLRRQLTQSFVESHSVTKRISLSSEFMDWEEFEEEEEEAVEEVYREILVDSGNRTLAMLALPFLLVGRRRDVTDISRRYTRTLFRGLRRQAVSQTRSLIDQARSQNWSQTRLVRELRLRISLSSRQQGAIAKLESRLKDDGVKQAEINRRLALESERKLQYRAKMIARTEASRARSRGTLLAFNEAGLDWAVYTTQPGACEICVENEMAGPEYKLSQAEDMIPAHPNCVCTWRPLYVSPSEYHEIAYR